MHGFTWQHQGRFLHAAEVRRQYDLQVVGVTTTESPSSQSSPTRLSCRQTSVTAVTVQGQSPTHHMTDAAATCININEMYQFIIYFILYVVFCCTLQKFIYILLRYYVVPHTNRRFTDRAFSTAALRACNQLPTYLKTKSLAVAEIEWRFVSLNILLSHSRSFEMTLLSGACVSPY